MIFSWEFFYIMVHLLDYLVGEVKLGGSEHLETCLLWSGILESWSHMFVVEVNRKISLQKFTWLKNVWHFVLIFWMVTKQQKNTKYSTDFETCVTQVEYYIKTRLNKDGTIFNFKICELENKSSLNFVQLW